MEPTKMVEFKEESFEIEPTCIKNEQAVNPETYQETYLVKEPSGKIFLSKLRVNLSSELAAT